MPEEEKNKEVEENTLAQDEPKEEPEEKGGIPEWAQKLQKQINEIAAKLESKPLEKKKEVVMIPEPVPPKQEEPTPEEQQDEPEQIQPKSKARTLWDWLK